MNKNVLLIIIFAPYEDAIRNSIKLVKDGGIVVQGVIGNEGIFLSPRELTKGTKIGTRYDMDKTLTLASENKIKMELKT